MKIGLDARGAEIIRQSENVIFRLQDGTIARVSRAGQGAAARKEVAVARWLERQNVPAVQATDHLDQPVDVDGRSVSFWRELPPHQHGTPVQVGTALRRLHSTELPRDFNLGPIQPFVRLRERIHQAATLNADDRAWLYRRLSELAEQWKRRPTGLPECVVHGDAWVGNVVATSDGRVVFVDLERTAIGPPEWDLVHTAIKRDSFGWITDQDYGSFCEAYGHDVTQWEGYSLLRDIRELRMTSMAIQLTTDDPACKQQASLRLECLQGKRGTRPWSGWAALP